MACVNEETLQLDDIASVPSRYLQKLPEGNVIQCFDLRELGPQVESKVREGQDPSNPQTRQRFTRAQLNGIYDAIVESQKDLLLLDANVYFGFTTTWLSPSTLGNLVSTQDQNAIQEDLSKIVQWIPNSLTNTDVLLQSFGSFDSQIKNIVSRNVDVSYKVLELEVPQFRFIDDRFVVQSRNQRCSQNVGTLSENIYGFKYRLHMQFEVKGLPQYIQSFDAANLQSGLATFFKVRFFSGNFRNELRRLDLGGVQAPLAVVTSELPPLAVPVDLRNFGEELPTAEPI